MMTNFKEQQMVQFIVLDVQQLIQIPTTKIVGEKGKFYRTCLEFELVQQ